MLFLLLYCCLYLSAMMKIGSALDFKPIGRTGMLILSIGLSLPSLLIAQGVTAYASRFWVKNMSKIALRLGSQSRKKREEAKKELQKMGKNAVSVLRQILRLPMRCAYKDWHEAKIFAAVELGRLKAKEAVPDLLEVLDESEPRLRSSAIWALGEIGDAQAIPKIIRLLGDFRSVYVHKVCFFATKEALIKLGEGEILSPFFKVVRERDKEALQFLRSHPYRKAIVEALMEVLNHYIVAMTEAINAAWALGELKAVEALPKLIRCLSWFSPKPLRQECQEAIAKIGEVMFLPMPANLTEIDTSRLPSPAKSSNFNTATLPRPASFSPNEKGGEDSAGRREEVLD